MFAENDVENSLQQQQAGVTVGVGSASSSNQSSVLTSRINGVAASASSSASKSVGSGTGSVINSLALRDMNLDNEEKLKEIKNQLSEIKISTVNAQTLSVLSSSSEENRITRPVIAGASANVNNNGENAKANKYKVCLLRKRSTSNQLNAKLTANPLHGQKKSNNSPDELLQYPIVNEQSPTMSPIRSKSKLSAINTNMSNSNLEDLTQYPINDEDDSLFENSNLI